MKTYSRADVGRSLTDSGIAVRLTQGRADRKYQPSDCRAKATRQGISHQVLLLESGGRFCVGQVALDADHGMQVVGHLVGSRCGIGIAEIDPAGSIVAKNAPDLPENQDFTSSI